MTFDCVHHILNVKKALEVMDIWHRAYVNLIVYGPGTSRRAIVYKTQGIVCHDRVLVRGSDNGKLY